MYNNIQISKHVIARIIVYFSNCYVTYSMLACVGGKIHTNSYIKTKKYIKTKNK